MAIADTKKVQTLINVTANEAEIIRAAVARMKAVRTLYNAASPDVTGTALEGNLTAVSNAIDAVDADIGGAVWDAMIAAKVPSHRGEAL